MAKLEIILQWGPARRPGMTRIRDPQSTRTAGLQWGPARRPGMTRRAESAVCPGDTSFNGARPEGRE